MPIITLTTDLGTGNFDLAGIKARIASQLPEAQVIDLCHEVEKFDIAEAAFILKSTIGQFPKGTVHVVGVGSGAIDDWRHLGIEYRGQYILTADNGFISLIADQYPDLVVELTMSIDTDILTFPARDLYTPAAMHLCRGGTLEVIGRRIENYQKRATIQPVIGDAYIKGIVTYVDDYGNSISNISKELFKKVGKGREFVIGFIQKGYEIDHIDKRYSDASMGDRLALFNSAGMLEIAINQGRASELLGLHKGETVIVSFDD